MKYPLWILNSLLLLILLIMLLFVWLSQEKIGLRGSLTPQEKVVEVIKETPTVNIAKIYERDLFDTYRKRPHPFYSGPSQPPRPPEKRAARIVTVDKPSFLDPLPITLKGIILVSQDDAKSMVTIEDNDTQQESMYKIGATIKDAQLIRIFKNKAIFVRSNGQQEILYLREKDAKSDSAYALLTNWEEVIEELNEWEYGVDPQLFVQHITNLAQFIDMLDLTTVYKQGNSIGCRIGNAIENSLGAHLGLESGDVILTVNGIPATTTTNRFKIYQEVIGSKLGDTNKVTLQRMGQEKTIRYLLHESSTKKSGEDDSVVSSEGILPEQVKEREIKSIEDRYKFAPTVGQIRAREKENMLRRGKNHKFSIIE